MIAYQIDKSGAWTGVSYPVVPGDVIPSLFYATEFVPPTLDVGQYAVPHSSGWAVVMRKPADRFFQSTRSSVIRVSDYRGADTTGNTDSYSALMRALEDVEEGGAIILDGLFYSTQGITIQRPCSIVGSTRRLSKLSTVKTSKSGLVFGPASVFGVDAPDGTTQLCLDAVSIHRTTLGGTGVRVTNTSVQCGGGAIIQGFDVGLALKQNWYSRVSNTAISMCKTGVDVDYCYNLGFYQSRVHAEGVAGSKGVVLRNRSDIAIGSASIEACMTSGLEILGASSAKLFSAYFENRGGHEVWLENGGAVLSDGAHVYLTSGTASFVKVAPGATKARIVSRGNKLVIPSDSGLAAAITAYDVGSGLSASMYSAEIVGDDFCTASNAPAPASATYYNGPANSATVRVVAPPDLL